jgi:predicted ATP-grasp superfamily ATP-dependent carboligase
LPAGFSEQSSTSALNVTVRSRSLLLAPTSPTSSPSAKIPTLILDAGQYGTLAAIRCLGRAGVPVTVAGPKRFVPAAHSRYTSRWLSAPSYEEPEQLVDWLLAFGRKEPGYYLPAGSDDLAWLLAHYRESLTGNFHLDQAAPSAIRRLLDKRDLMAACESLGIGVPKSVFPPAGADIRRLSQTLSFPLLVKPRTQVLHRYQGKGIFVSSADELPAAYETYLATNKFHPWIVARCADIGQPMLQTYYPSAAAGIYSVAGFANPDGSVVALASRKTLQRPRRLGIGLCFESAELRPEVESALVRLCRLVGYAGIFEAEFVEADGQLLLIDFNPRYYSQMRFEMDRGLPLPLLAYQLTTGTPTQGQPFASLPSDGRGYMHAFLFAILIRGWRLSGQMTAAEARQWFAWRDRHPEGMLSFASRDAEDRMPGLVDRINITINLLKHPRANVRWLLLER